MPLPAIIAEGAAATVEAAGLAARAAGIAARASVAQAGIDFIKARWQETDRGDECQWTPLMSSNVSAFCYRGAAQELDVEFKGGRRYKYFGIPEHMVADLLLAPSPGAWVNENLKGARFEKE